MKCKDCGFRRLPERMPLDGHLAFYVAEQCVCQLNGFTAMEWLEKAINLRRSA